MKRKKTQTLNQQETFVERLGSFIDHSKLDKTEISAALGVSRRTLYGYLNGRIRKPRKKFIQKFEELVANSHPDNLKATPHQISGSNTPKIISTDPFETERITLVMTNLFALLSLKSKIKLITTAELLLNERDSELNLVLAPYREKKFKK